MKIFDTLCALLLAAAAVVDCLIVPRTYTGRIWIFGTALALLFAAMFNLLRIGDDVSVRHLKNFCIVANIAMLTFAVGLMVSIGKTRALQHLQIPVIALLLLGETAFSLGKKS
jgi:hypothetical protein